MIFFGGGGTLNGVGPADEGGAVVLREGGPGTANDPDLSSVLAICGACGQSMYCERFNTQGFLVW